MAAVHECNLGLQLRLLMLRTAVLLSLLQIAGLSWSASSCKYFKCTFLTCLPYMPTPIPPCGHLLLITPASLHKHPMVANIYLGMVCVIVPPLLLYLVCLKVNVAVCLAPRLALRCAVHPTVSWLYGGCPKWAAQLVLLVLRPTAASSACHTAAACWSLLLSGSVALSSSGQYSHIMTLFKLQLQCCSNGSVRCH